MCIHKLQDTVGIGLHIGQLGRSCHIRDIPNFGMCLTLLQQGHEEPVLCSATQAPYCLARIAQLLDRELALARAYLPCLDAHVQTTNIVVSSTILSPHEQPAAIAVERAADEVDIVQL